MIIIMEVQANETVNVLEEVAKLAKREGVEYVFTLPGGNEITLDWTMQRAGIKRVMLRHEQACGFAMDAWGRLSRRPGFAVVGPGTGLTNFTTGVVQAMSAGAPGVGIVAESGTMDDDLLGGQGLARSEQQFAGITKWARRVTYPTTLLFQVQRAFRSAVTQPTGPAVVAYTNELMGGGLIVPKAQAYTNYTPAGWKPDIFDSQGNPAKVEKVVRWLLEAEKPAMVAGHAAHQDDCQDEMREFVRILGLPTSTRRVARGMISELDPLNYQKARGQVMAQADRCLVFGIKVGSYLEGFGGPNYYPTTCRYAQVMPTPDMTCLALNTDIEVTGNLKMILKQMLEVLKDMGIKSPPDKWNKWREFVATTTKASLDRQNKRTEPMVGKSPLHPDLVGRYCAEVLTDKYNDDYIGIIDGFTASAYFTNWNVAQNTGTVLDAAETIGIGHGPGMAVAAGLYTNREKPIIVVMGDGGLGAGGMDIETCVRWNIPAVFIHENNDVLMAGFFESCFAKVAKPTGDINRDSWQVTHKVRYDRGMADLGCHTEFVEKSEQVKPAIEKAIEVSLREKRPSFIEAFVDPDAMSTLFSGPALAFMLAGSITWDDVPNRGKEIMLRTVPPQMTPMFPQDWQEGFATGQKK